MCGALLIGVILGALARLIIPNDAFQGMKGPKSWLISLVLGIVGSILGYLLFVGLFHFRRGTWGLGGLLGGLVGTLIVLGIASAFLKRTGRAPGGRNTPRA